MQRSLLNFFQRKSHPTESKATPTLYRKTHNQESPAISPESSDEEVVPSTRRKRLIIESSDEENSPIPGNSQKNNDCVHESSFDRLADFTCSPSVKTGIPLKSLENATMSKKQRIDIAEPASPCLPMEISAGTDTMVWEHLSLPFLQSGKRRDSAGRRPDHPEYDKTTLLVPHEFLSRQTPGMRQWWDIKSRYADVILFFKMGKFYELYHMDAVVGVEQLGLIYMKGSYAHCGFPEVAFSRYADVLIRKGYKVCRVEQTESVDAMTERTRNARGSDKVVRREVCQLLTPGTCTVDMRSDISAQSLTDDSATGGLLESPESILLAVTQRISQESFETPVFGVGILDAANGKIQIGQFLDDRHCSRLRTLIAQHFPSQILVERGTCGPALKTILATVLSSVPVEYLKSDKQFWSAKQILTELETADYFNSKQLQNAKFSGKEHWPEAILDTLSTDDPLGRSVKPDHDLALSCLGAIVFYLRYCLIDREVLSLGYIEQYRPADMVCSDPCKDEEQAFYQKQTSLILDSITLANLDILANNSTGTREGTLIERLDTCCTPFGRRLLRQWVTAPMCNPIAIRRRQDAVDSLLDNYDKLTLVKDYLRRLPDFDRLLTKIHLIGSRGKDKTHPDSRAIIYEEVQYSRKNIADFVATLNGFELVYELIHKLNDLNLSSAHLKHLIQTSEAGGQFPSLSTKLSFFKNAFDAEKAKRDGRIIPEPGVDQSYDAAVQEIKRINDELDTHLMQSSKLVGTRLVYWGTARNRFQIEVPDSFSSRVPSDWQLASQRKGFKRYRNSTTQDLLNRMMLAEERKDLALRQIMQNLFSSFSESFTEWHAAMRAIAELDCLIALSCYSLSASDVMCRPEFVDIPDAEQPFLEIVDGRHPCLINTITTGDLIPNDIRLGSGGFPRTVLVTGPNMGGKSTLMRQAALLVILAHLGCRIPAKSCRLTPVDRIFSRLGASDRLLAGESTFMVELSETAAILNHLSPHSLVLMDELGRGTSTHDGAALASAVLHFLANPAPGVRGPRSLFSTHYHNLVDEVAVSNKSSPVDIGLGHMACMLEEQSATEAGLENITFLYKFIEGACPKSYGFNVARLAHLPDKVIQTGLVKAKEFERTLTTFSCLRKLLSGSLDLSTAQDWLNKLQNF